MFSCKSCLAKTNHIEDLHTEIKFLRTMLSPEPPSLRGTFVDLEANRILDGGAMPIIEIADVTSDRFKHATQVQEEADIILSGNY